MAEVHLVGIVNASPESFSTYYENAQECIEATERFFAQGATWVDIGGQASNPWAKQLGIDEEWRRLEPIVAELIPKYPGLISVDSYRPEIHRRIARLKLGQFIVNDVTGMNNPDMRELVAELDEANDLGHVIVSHLPATYGVDIQEAHEEHNCGSMGEVYDELTAHERELVSLRIPPRKIILDPGIGFGKKMATNWELLEFPALLWEGQACMIGHSHKRFLSYRQGTDEKLSKDNEYNELQRGSAVRNHDAAAIAIAAAGDRPIYLRVHELEPYLDLIS
jgi:dihydropteroate synthase